MCIAGIVGVIEQKNRFLSTTHERKKYMDRGYCKQVPGAVKTP